MELPYWYTLLIRHNLDVIHIKRNVFEIVFNTMMNVKDKIKDNIKARMDLKVYCKRPTVELVELNGRFYMAKASYVLTKDQIKVVCEWIKQLKFSDGYASNIVSCVNVENCKIGGFKSHDCHIFIQ